MLESIYALATAQHRLLTAVRAFLNKVDTDEYPVVSRMVLRFRLRGTK
jgi:hypothetical protein